MLLKRLFALFHQYSVCRGWNLGPAIGFEVAPLLATMADDILGWALIVTSVLTAATALTFAGLSSTTWFG